HHERDQVELARGRAGAAAGHGVRADDRPGLLVQPDVLRGFVRGAHRIVHASGWPAVDRTGVVRYWPTRVTSIAISYAMSPMSACCAASTARQAPWPAAVTNRNADSISTIVWRTAPPPNCRPAPRARL